LRASARAARVEKAKKGKGRYRRKPRGLRRAAEPE